MSRPKADLTTGDYAFLGFLARGLTSAYDVKKAIAGSISFFWTAAHSQVYEHAARLVRLGYVREKAQSQGRRKKVLTLTPKGRAALRRWLREPAKPVELRDEMLVKVFFAADAGDPAAIARLLESQRGYFERGREEFTQIRDVLGRWDDPAAPHALATLELGLEVVGAYLRWLDATIPKYAKPPAAAAR
jgi:PadR family transcriptional regulator AphA